MTPRRRLEWDSADEYGVALARLRNEVASAYGVSLALMPLAWFRDGDLLRCSPCHAEVRVLLGGVLRCADCGATAEVPEGWSR